MLKDGRLRVVTYNVHTCVGLDRRERPGRIAAVLREIEADVVALQEVVSVESDSSREAHQARFIAEELGCQFHLGENRKHRGGAYGNVVLTRMPVAHCHNYDITWRWQAPRGAWTSQSTCRALRSSTSSTSTSARPSSSAATRGASSWARPSCATRSS